MHPFHHAKSSVRKHGGAIEDYLPLHDWFDASKEFYANFRHRAVRHHAQGIFEAERVFGPTIRNSDGDEIPVRVLGEQHVREDCGRVPSIQDWLKNIKGEHWMMSPGRHEHDNPPGEAVRGVTEDTRGSEH
jgi:hypothetical protein